MNSDSSIWGTLVVAGIGAVIGAIGTIITALINRQHPMAALIDARIRLLIEGYERRISNLQNEVMTLEQKVDALTMALEEARSRRGFEL